MGNNVLMMQKLCNKTSLERNVWTVGETGYRWDVRKVVFKLQTVDGFFVGMSWSVWQADHSEYIHVMV